MKVKDPTSKRWQLAMALVIVSTKQIASQPDQERDKDRMHRTSSIHNIAAEQRTASHRGHPRPVAVSFASIPLHRHVTTEVVLSIVDRPRIFTREACHDW